MKPLNQYSTPETDKSKFQLADKQFAITASKARSLERRLAMCRDALKSSQDLMKQLKPLVDEKYKGSGDIFFESALEDNETALKATEPK